MRVALKAALQVTAGVVPGIGMAEYTKRWEYTSEDYESDRETPPDRPTIFSKLLDEAHDYAKGLTNPVYVNWVHTEWLWI
jgi:hypothetical protein